MTAGRGLFVDGGFVSVLNLSSLQLLIRGSVSKETFSHCTACPPLTLTARDRNLDADMFSFQAGEVNDFLMMSGDISHRSQYPAADGQPSSSTRGLGNGRHSPTSPLKLFGQAKKKVNDIFVDIGLYIDETDTFLSGAFP